MTQALIVLAATLLPFAHAQETNADGTPAKPVEVLFKTTSGNFTIELDADRAPKSVANFLAYVDAGHYNGTIFHRVIAGFVAQGGGFDKDYNQKPTREAIENESSNGLANARGTIAMARMGAPHSATSQFYINLVDNPALDFRGTVEAPIWGYTVFGKVSSGMDTLDRIAQVATGPAGPFPSDVPQAPVIVESAVRVEKR